MTEKVTQSVSNFRRLNLFLLPLLSISAIYCCWFLSIRNGLFRQIKEIFEQEHDERRFPGTREPFVQVYTSMRPLDKQLTTLVAFFAPVVERSNPPLDLFAFWTFGQFAAVWSLMFMESLRQGNKNTIINWIGIYGISVQNLSLAVTTPVYLLAHLISSPIAKPLPFAYSTNALTIPSYDIELVPISILLGYVLPSALMMYSGKAWSLGSPVHQMFIALWQVFPVLTVLTHWVLRTLYIFVQQQRPQKSVGAIKSSPAALYLRSAQRVYIFIVIFCTLTHLPTILICAASTSLSHYGASPHTFPLIGDMISPKILTAFVNFIGKITFASVFLPPSPVPNQQQVDSLAAGVHAFLQWDLYISALSCLIWSVFLYRNTVSALGKEKGAWWRILVKVMFWTLLAGPFGAVTVLLWERDGVVKQKVKQGI